MFRHRAPIRMPCSRSLACYPVDLICRCEHVARTSIHLAIYGYGTKTLQSCTGKIKDYDSEFSGDGDGLHGHNCQ